MNSDWHYKSIFEIHNDYKNLDILPSELVSYFYDRIEKLDPVLSAFICLTKNEAYKEAKIIDNYVKKGKFISPLMGIPIALKDICDIKGYPTTGGSNSRRDFVPKKNSTIVKKLKDSGAIIVGKLALTEGAFIEHASRMPEPKNPWNLEYSTGVSSSGAAVAVAAGLCTLAIGSDTGGSIRYPSICCGVTGVKPTFGRVSTFGIMPLAPSLDHIGPIGRNARDCAALMNVISGHDPDDPNSSFADIRNYLSTFELDIKGLKVGYDPEYNETDVDSQLYQAINKAMLFLSDLGVSLVEIKIPNTKKITPKFTDLVSAEAYSENKELLERGNELGQVYKELLINGSKLNNDSYVKLLKSSREFSNQLSKVFNSVDIIICPPWPTAALNKTIDSLGDINNQGDLLRFTVPYNISGNPSITIPSGFNKEGMPLAFQLISSHFKEEKLFQLSNAYQLNTSWHLKHPDIKY
ncbi:MAG: Asp-tRNA(Asn)/Glu-tRNA(Gln) amidotransferase GatCAB subunit A [Rhodospirillaceae bacterium]|nr:Asp-tRNA(Asn)/Glu-tRNA(Gln) amidotransferase GatCAB subunit A [Rhodospirillaceae bacterium]|tara:strand:+ start:7599 stop:8993 length:1395 start_codon:yes stop_codon:yes gene_type:complete